MTRYINVDQCDEVIKKSLGIYDTTELKEMLSYFPTADVQKVKHGEWIHDSYNKTVFRCSKCGRLIQSVSNNPSESYPYCHCGAKMDGE